MNEFTGYFALAHYSQSHRLFLFRDTSPDQEGKPLNTDIIFHGVSFIETLINYENPIIRIDNILSDQLLMERFNFKRTDYKKVFHVEVRDTKYYLGCSHYSVSKNNLKFGEASFHLTPDFVS